MTMTDENRKLPGEADDDKRATVEGSPCVSSACLLKMRAGFPSRQRWLQFS